MTKYTCQEKIDEGHSIERFTELYQGSAYDVTSLLVYLHGHYVSVQHNITLGFSPTLRVLIIKTAVLSHRVSHEFIGSRNCVPMAFTVENPPAQGQ